MEENKGGEETQQTTYITDEHINKIYKPERQEEIHRNMWRRIFEEEEEEEEDIDSDEGDEEKRNTQQNVYIHLNNNLNRITPTQQMDLTRLNNNQLDRKIFIKDIKHIIKSIKNTAPGRSNINKITLKNLPEIALEGLKNIYNATLSAGYYPDA